MSKHARLESTITRALSEILRTSVKDPAIGFITLTAVKLTNDLSFLTVYYRVLDDNKQELTATALERSKAYIRVTLGKKVNMRKLPKILFKYDASLDVGNKIEAGLNKLKDEE